MASLADCDSACHQHHLSLFVQGSSQGSPPMLLLDPSDAPAWARAARDVSYASHRIPTLLATHHRLASLVSPARWGSATPANALELRSYQVGMPTCQSYKPAYHPPLPPRPCQAPARVQGSQAPRPVTMASAKLGLDACGRHGKALVIGGVGCRVPTPAPWVLEGH